MSVFYCEIKDDLADLGPHHVPIEKIALPLRVQSDSFYSLGMGWDGIFDIFEGICTDKGLEMGVTSSCQAIASRELGDGITQQVFIEHRTNHFIFQVWTVIAGEEVLLDVSELEYLMDVAYYFNLPPVCSTLIMIEGELESSDASFFFGDKKVFASAILDENALLWTAHCQDDMGRELFVVVPSASEGRKRLERDAVKTVDSIIHLETLFHLITEPKNNFRSMVDEIRRIEGETDKTIEGITINLDTRDLNEIRGWLKQISVDFVRFNTFKQQLEQHFADMQLYQDEVETVLYVVEREIGRGRTDTFPCRTDPYKTIFKRL